MPHSSGGGSHSGGSSYSSHSSGGGSHSGGYSGGSSHSSGGGSYSSGYSSSSYHSSYSSSDDDYSYSSGRLFGHSTRRERPQREPRGVKSNDYRPGYKTYYYYDHGRPHYIYATNTLKPKTGVFKWFTVVVLSIIITILSFSIIEKLIFTDYELRENGLPEVYDNTGTVKLTEDLYDELIKFKKKTGITPCIYVTNKIRTNEYSGFSDYALNTYISLYKDEDHWLIVYYIPKEDPNDWRWEAIQGDNTDSVLTKERCENYIETIHKYLLADNFYSDSEAFTKAFEYINDDLGPYRFKKTIPSIIIVNILACIVVLIIAFPYIRGYKDKDLKLVTKTNNNGKPKETKCEYCDSIYIYGEHLSCPHCGAPIPAKQKKQKTE